MRVAADVGGTFTDIILRLANGEITFEKVLSTPPAYDRAVVDGIVEVLGKSVDPLRIHELEEVAHGTTVATNAVLERRGAKTALVTTKGFRDVLELRRVRMPHLYDLFWTKPRSVVERRLRFEIDERMTAEGDVLRPIDEDEVRALARHLRTLGVESVAVCLLHAHRHPEHERQVGELLRAELPDVPVSLSSGIVREQQEYERTAATVVNAYVLPLMERYIEAIDRGLSAQGLDAPLTIMQSSGGVMTAREASRRPVFALESGPAAGVVGALSLAKSLGIDNVITFDMGGTTAKASLIEEGRISRSREYEVGASISAGTRLLRGSGELIRIPTIDIAEVGAGGGSLVWLDAAGGLHVGPSSAGAEPGPACYGRGGVEPTTTDANVVLGYIPTGQLASGDITVSRERATQALRRVADELGLETIELARGIHSLANAAMMRALRAVSSEKGRDPQDFALIAYGGSGPIHAAALAAELGVRSVIVPPLAGLFSAIGLLSAASEFHDVRFCHIDAGHPDLPFLRSLEAEMRLSLEQAIGSADAHEWLRSADVRFKGQSWDIEIDFPGTEIDNGSVATLVARFVAEHERVYGVRYQEESPVEIRALRCAVRGHPRDSAVLHVHTTSERRESPGTRLADFGTTHGTIETPVFPRGDIPAEGIAGPCLIDEYDTTVVVPPGWDVRRDARDILTLTASAVDVGARQDDVAYADAIMQEIVGNALASIADEMATTIFRTAHSTIVRDVMDFSAALCDATGETVAQAVTLPLHLGAIPTAMRALLERYGGRMENGDIFLMNDPFSGGMHTPDLFIVKPVFFDGSIVGYAVTVAHHADVGGRLAGTTACDNTDIFQEGLRLPWVRLYQAGKPVEDIIGLIRTNVRIPNMTMGDINAQIAACTIAERALWDLSVRYGRERLAALMVRLVDHTEAIVRGEIAAWPKGTASFVDYLDSDGLETRDVRIEVELTVRDDEVIVDFSKSAPMVQGALNATVSYTEASVYQAIMCAVASEIPNTSGAFRPVKVVTKPGTITHVVMPGASTMRGVTGFRVFDAVNGALAQLIPDRIPAAGEGGNTLAIFAGTARDGEPFIYYELVVGTWGALPVKDGNDGLCNPCATAANIPVEVAESEFPIMIERYGFIPDTGGAGRYRGGLAIERVWRTLAPATSLQVRSDRQNHSPYGLHGGRDGSRSANLLSDGAGWRAFPPMFSAVVDCDTVFHHKMPGAGGWGDPLEREPQRVADDVLDDKVSVECAREQYGVVLDTDGAVDARGTDELRAALRGAPERLDRADSERPL